MKRYRAIADYYDAENADEPMLHEDVPFFLGQMPKRRQSVLELAVGTGRAAIPIAQAGHRVVGVDYADDMLAIARRKRDAVGLTEKDLPLLRGDITSPRLDLRKKFDWVCVFFNTFLGFPTLDEQDRVLAVALRHLAPRGRFWLDVFQPDHSILSRPASIGLSPTLFFVPRHGRTVLKTTDVRPAPHRQTQWVTFNYRWLDAHGAEHRQKTQFEGTYIFPRELRLLLERNGLRIEHLWGNYDGSLLGDDSPRMIARCCRP